MFEKNANNIDLLMREQFATCPAKEDQSCDYSAKIDWPLKSSLNEVFSAVNMSTIYDMLRGPKLKASLTQSLISCLGLKVNLLFTSCN